MIAQKMYENQIQYISTLFSVIDFKHELNAIFTSLFYEKRNMYFYKGIMVIRIILWLIELVFIVVS